MTSLTPSASMSKEKLRNELQAHNIRLPPANSKKDVLVQLYEKHVVDIQNRSSEFSSDEEDGFKVTKNDVKAQRSIFTSSFDGDKSSNKHNVIVDGLNISELSDDELRQRLLNFNVPVGPIVETTRLVYERKLSRLLRGEVEGEISNGNYQKEEFSDSDVEVESTHSITSPSSTHYSSFETAKKKTEEPIPPKLFSRNTDVPDNALINRALIRETPTPRRSLRDNISYTPTDRNLYADLINRDVSSVSNIASNLVEDTPEPQIKNKKTANSMSLLRKFLMVILGLAILLVLVYYNMEVNEMKEIKHLPGNK